MYMFNSEMRRKTMKRILYSMLLAALCLSLSAHAFAESDSTVLNYLSNAELFQKQMYFENMDIESGDDKVKAFIDDAVWQNDELHIGLKFDVNESVYAVIDEITINKTAYDISSSSFDGQWLEAASNQAAQGISIPVQMPEDRHFDISVSISFLSSKDAIQYISGESNASIWKAIDEAVQQGKTPADQDEPHSVFVSSAYFDSDFDEAMDVSYPLNSPEVLVEYSNMSVVSTLKEDFSISW